MSSNNLVFFAIHADDLSKAQRFYERVFGWKFEPWGPPGFLLIATGDKQDPGIQGALQKRYELVPGQRLTGYECTIGVEDIDATEKVSWPTVGKSSCPSARFPPSAT
jgi:uncharacterized protein